MTGVTPATAVIVDPQEVVRRGMRCVLEEDGHVVVVGEGGTLAEARRLAAAQPDVALVELHLPDGDGVQLVRECHATGHATACVLVGDHPCERAVLSAAMAGAAGVLDKRESAAALLAAVLEVVERGSLFDDGTIDRLLQELASEDTPEHDETLVHLTPQERRVFELVGRGLTNREVGAQLHLTEKTVKNYVSRILAKLGMHHRTQIAMLAGRLVARDELDASVA